MMKVDSETEEQKEMMMEQENYKKSRQESGNCRVFDRKGSNHHRKEAAMMCNKTTMVMTMVMAMLTRTKREREREREKDK